MTLARFAIALSLMLYGIAAAQQPMGTASTGDLALSGGLDVQNGRAQLLNNASLISTARPAAVQLARGGDLLVCGTTQMHLLHSGPAAGLLFGLDHGAFELRGKADAQDSVLTPDLRFTPVTGGALDLRVRVTTTGDTCVDNAGKSAPVLLVRDAFSPTTYRVLPGQHITFLRGSLREVVDHERAPCGCAPAPALAANAAEARNPFPEAASQGLTPDAVPVTPAAGASAAGGTPLSVTGERSPVQTGEQPSTPAAAKPKQGFGARLAGFFHHLFHPHS